MNAPIRRVAVVTMVLLAALVVGTTYWQAWAVGDLADRQDNAIQRVAQFRIRRGLILTQDGTVLAANRIKQTKTETFFFRRYPSGKLMSNIVGYSTQARARTGLERSLNDYLTASNASLNTVFRTALDRVSGKTITGNSVVVTIDPAAQRLAQELLGSNCGSVVALDPRTGKLLVAATSPGYDPRLVENDFAAIGKTKANCAQPAPLLDRATAGLYVPGSAFKVVTAAAAIDSGKFTPDSRFDDPGYCMEYGKPVYNFADQSGPERFGNVDLRQALQHSINAVFCEIGKAIGPHLILDYAKRFGFYALPPLETPENERRESGLYRKGRPFLPRKSYDVDVGRLAFGQERMLVTPLQMAMVVGGIANHGTVMRPYVVDEILTPADKRLRKTTPKVYSQAVKASTAEELTAMMESVVTAGTGTNAQIPGVRVAGKTGTAETGVDHRNTTWFVAFAPADAPKVAIAVVLENQTATGGATAAPIAKRVLENLLRVGSDS